MKTKTIIVSVFLILVFIIGGCGMFKQNNQLTLTKEQQDNVVRWIARGYEVKSVEFTNFSQDGSTGTYLLSFKLNSDKNYETTIPTNEIRYFNKADGSLRLGPISNFKEIERNPPLADNVDVGLNNIQITYLGER